MKYLLYLLMFISVSVIAQIGPITGGGASAINTWNVVQSYSLGQVVARYGVFYQSLVNANVAHDPAGSASQWTTNIGTASGGGVTPFIITASAIPVINIANGPLQTITLTSAATPTVTGISAGSHLIIQICQGATVYAWTWPTAIHGGICVGTSCSPTSSLANTCSSQTFNSYTGSTLVPENVGVINVAP